MTRLGVLGGMGPLATTDFLRKLIAVTPAETDPEHIPVIVYSVPQVPDRIAPILRGTGDSPLPAMTEGMRTLEDAGAQFIAIPCITAHHWYDDLVKAARVPIIHIADAVCTMLQVGAAGRIGLLATAATLHSGFFQRRLEGAGFDVLLPREQDTKEFVLPAIACVKRYDMTGALPLAAQAVERLLERGAQNVVLACSELPSALEATDAEISERCVDTLEALAKACVAWGLEQHLAETLR
ncbi:MAG: aspartate/glutamate racemase family protein [Acidiferrobacterales bacterium]